MSDGIAKIQPGFRVGMLRVTEATAKRKGRYCVWLCRCDCGGTVLLDTRCLQRGTVTSCGCHLRVQHGPKAENPRGLVQGTCVTMLRARLKKPPIATNTSGYNGVYKNANGSWSAQITFKGKTRYLGSYANLDEAAAAREKANQLFEDFIVWYQTQEKKEQAIQQCPRET